MHMRRGLFCFLLFGFLYAQSQPSSRQYIPLVLKPFVESSLLSSFDQHSTKKIFALIGELPKTVSALRKLSDTITIVQIEDPQIITSLWKLGKLMPVNDAWKFPPGFIAPATTEMIHQQKAWLIETTDTDILTKRIHEKDAVTITSISGKHIQLNASWKWIQEYLVQNPSILFIAPVAKPFTERELTGFDLSANKGNLAHRIWPTINGSGRSISIKENKLDTADIDFKGRYVSSSLASSRIETHATTMATIAAGGGNTFYTGKGFAYGASITSSDFANLLPDPLSEVMRLRVGLQNHSYGTGIENYYGADAAAYDRQTNSEGLGLLHIFSAGNQGTQASSSGNYAGINGFANLTGSFKMSKNSIAVGATDSFGVVPALSSRGPAYDGRLKPELVALGEDGSSGAAAIVSGITALLQQAYQQKNNTEASTDMIRAVLFNSADDIGSPGPDFVSGYGMANAYRAIKTIQDDRLINGYVRDSQEWVHQITVPAGARNLKITLSWTDHPAQTNAYKALVNDLDMILEHPASAQTWLPWVLNSYPHPDSLRKNAVRKKDTLNNHEQITIALPAAGTYNIKISGTSIPTLAQIYAIAWQYDTVSHFIFSYPVKGDLLEPARKNTLRWETTITDTATLEYKLNDGNWQTVANGVNLSHQYFQWQPPDTTAAIQLRMKATQRSWLSDTVGISKNLLINTGFNCADSFLVYWQKAKVDSYRVYRLGEQYLEPFITVSDTALIQLKQNNPYSFFSIAPLLPLQREGRRAYTFDYRQQQVACYISGFIADPFGNNAARLNLQLGTTYQVKKVVFEKLTASGFSAFQEITPVTNTQLTITTPANNGLNVYRARIELQNGTNYYTHPEQVLLFGAAAYYVFPNPIQPGATLNIMDADPDNKEFRLYDIFGRLVMKESLQGLRNQVRMPLLQRGVYFYVIIQNNDRILNGRLIVQ